MLKKKGANKHDGNGKSKLVQEGIDGVHFLSKVLFNIDGCGTPENGSHYFAQIADEHKFVVFAWLALENKEDAEKCKDEPHSFQDS